MSLRQIANEADLILEKKYAVKFGLGVETGRYIGSREVIGKTRLIKVYMFRKTALFIPIGLIEIVSVFDIYETVK